MINYVRRRRIILIAMAVVSILFLIFIFNLINNALNDNSKPSSVDMSEVSLLSSTSDSSISMEIRKEIQADEYFSTYLVTVSPSTRSIVAMTGYDKKIVNSKSYGNNKYAYEQFVYALNKADILNIRNLNENDNDTRGVCPTGTLTTFNVTKGQTLVKKIWTTSCKDSKGNMKANYSKIYNLFVTQFPDDAKSIISEL